MLDYIRRRGELTPRGGIHGSRGPAEAAVALRPVLARKPARWESLQTGRLGGESVHYLTLRSRPIGTCQQEPNQRSGVTNQNVRRRRSVCPPAARYPRVVVKLHLVADAIACHQRARG